MRYKSTLLLLIAVAVAGIVAYSLSKEPTSEELQKLRKRLLADMNASNIETLIIEGGEQRFVCERQADADVGWRLTEPIEVRADRWEVEGILDKLELAEKVASTFPEGGKALDLARYGLAEPVRKITLREEQPGGRTWTVLVGKEAGVADAVYMAVRGEDAVYAVKKDVADRADVTLTDLRTKKLATRISTLDMKKVTVSAAELDGEPGFEVVCERAEDRWELKRPVHDLADEGAVKGVANKLYDHHIGADEFVVDDPTKAAEYGLADPALTVIVEGQQETQTFVLSRHVDGEEVRYYAMHKGEVPIVEVPETLFNDLRKDADDLRERSLGDFTVADVAQLSIAGPAGELVLMKQDDAWQIAGDTPVAADDGVMDDVLRGLKEAEVDEFVADEPEDLADFGLSEGARTQVVATDSDGKTLAEVFLGSADELGERLYAQRSAYPPVLALKKADFLDRIARGRLAFLDRLVLEEPRGEAREVLLTNPEGRFRCTWNEESAEWALAEPVSGKADQVAVRALVGDFASLRAETFAAERADDLSAFGLAEPAVEATVTYRTESGPAGEEEGETEVPGRTRTLLIGAETESPAEGRFARLAGDERVFVLPDYIAGHFLANLASRRISTVFKPTAVTFASGAGSRRFLYDDEKDAWTDADGNDLPEGTAEALKDAVRLLRHFDGAAIADYVAKEPQTYGFDEPYLTVEVQDELEQVNKVLIGGETDEGDRYARGFVTDFVLRAAKADVRTLMAVLEEPAEPVDDAAPAEGEADARQ